MLPRIRWVTMGSAACVNLAIMALCPSACAAPDPNADRRARLVTVAEPHRGLGEAISRLGTQAEMRLIAVQHLADRRVTIYAKERPLHELMGRLEELWSLPQFPARWRIDPKKPQRGGLRQDPRADLEQERRYQADRDRIMQSLDRAIALSTSLEPPKPAGDDPVLANLVRPGNWQQGGRAFMRMLSGMNPQERQTFVTGGLLQVPFSSLSPQTREIVANEYLLPTFPDFGNQAVNLADQVLELQLALGERGSKREWRLLVTAHQAGSSNAGTRGLLLAPLEIAGDPVSDAPAADSLPSVLKQPVPTSVRDALLRVGTFPNRENWKEWSDFLGFLHRETGFTLLSDYHHDRKAPEPGKLAEAKEYADLIGEAARAGGYRWRWSKGALLFRNRTWYGDDRNELPATLEAQADASLAKHGYLDVETVLALSQLSDRQLRRLSDRVPTIGHLTSYRWTFGWIQQLSLPQRRKVESDAGLRVADSPPRAQAALLPHDGRQDAMLAMFTDPARIRFSGFGQFREPEGLVTRLKVQGQQGPNASWVELRFIQPIRPVTGSKAIPLMK